MRRTDSTASLTAIRASLKSSAIRVKGVSQRERGQEDGMREVVEGTKANDLPTTGFYHKAGGFELTYDVF